MRGTWWSRLGWVAAGLGLALVGSALIAQRDLQARRAAFETDARIAHRLLSQQAVQHDAVLATLRLLAPTRNDALPRLSAIHPRVQKVLARAAGETWPDATLSRAEEASRAVGHAVMADDRIADGHYTLVQAAGESAYALEIALDGLVPDADWPMDRTNSPVRVALALDKQIFPVQAGRPLTQGWHFDFDKVVAAESQPMHVVATRWVGWGELPWTAMAGWTVAVVAALWALRQGLRQREARQRAEALLRLGQLGRLNAMGEFAAGLAHELNQPLTAVLANTQAAQRMLKDDPPAIATAQDAMGAAAAQARRAADVLGRLRRGLEQDASTNLQRPLALGPCVRDALHLMHPDIEQLGVTVRWLRDEPVTVMADPVALDQIVHNLLSNALQALARQTHRPRALRLSIQRDGSSAVLQVEDTGPGLSPTERERVFEPFFTTREGGLGLGLTLSESLARAQGGELSADHAPDGGACFRLRLPCHGDTE
ncbi:HAMP domain-containing sensor histidine kinase [Hydrogenophaga sp.]|uniref:sensor histidine kinase n=1 Tax=Hydrogenophaga sp. TaxID=1904254 RepID=UPI0025BAC441|nr:HAMP domain-containing sensor histidine kinase [Hydrogenophaga sp.]